MKNGVSHRPGSVSKRVQIESNYFFQCGPDTGQFTLNRWARSSKKSQVKNNFHGYWSGSLFNSDQDPDHSQKYYVNFTSTTKLYVGHMQYSTTDLWEGYRYGWDLCIHPTSPPPPTPTPRAICVKKSCTRLSALAQKEVGKVAVEEGGQARHSQDQQRRGNLKRQNLIIPSCVCVPVQGSDLKQRCLIKLSFLNLRRFRRFTVLLFHAL